VNKFKKSLVLKGAVMVEVKDQLSIQRIQYHGSRCLELSVSSYETFRYHHHF